MDGIGYSVNSTPTYIKKHKYLLRLQKLMLLKLVTGKGSRLTKTAVVFASAYAAAASGSETMKRLSTLPFSRLPKPDSRIAISKLFCIILLAFGVHVDGTQSTNSTRQVSEKPWSRVSSLLAWDRRYFK
jgi:hypothetical protein